MLTGITRGARFSECGTYRLTLTRRWDDRPILLVVMFNPSDADHQRDDPTVSLVMQIAAYNSFGGITVMNGIPLCGSKPAPAIDMVNTWDKRQDWYQRDWLQRNLGEIAAEAEKAGAVLLAWGALADRCADWFDAVREEIECAVAEGTPIYCLGKTQAGYPKHPLARGKHKVRKDAPLVAVERGRLMLTAAQAAKQLGISVRAVYELRYRGNLPAAAVRPYRFTPEAVAAFVASCRTEEPRPPKPRFRLPQAEMVAAIGTIGRRK